MLETDVVGKAVNEFSGEANDRTRNLRKIVEIIQESRGEEFQVSQTLSLKDDLQADSVDLMEFILTVEG